jgi:DNA polymerase alpha-associated DNA helicase A
VNDTSGSGSKKLSKDKGKAGGKDTVEASKGPEGVVTRVGEKSIWIAFGHRGGGGRSKEDDETIEELWGKKLWLYVLCHSMQHGSFDLRHSLLY